MRSGGFTLFEVLLALVILTAGILGFLGAIGGSVRLAATGREQGRIAAALESRIEQLRGEISSPCGAPPSGTARWPDGVVESWTSVARPGSVELLLSARIAGRAGRADTVLTRILCP